jgi:hypothetical protein
MILILRISVVLTLLAIGACDNPTSSVRSDIPIEGAAAYFPVSVGNRWVYATTDQEGRPAGFDTVTVTGVEGDIATLYGPGTSELRYRVTETAVTQTVEFGGVHDSSAHLIRIPLSVGTQWQSYFNEIEIIAVDTVISTSAGTFHDVVAVTTAFCAGYGPIGCVAIVSYPMITYFAKGVGPVKYEMWVPSGTGQTYGRSLVSYGR